MSPIGPDPTDALSPDRRRLLERVLALQESSAARDASFVNATQARFFLLEALRPGHLGARLLGVTHLDGPLDTAAFTRALSHVFARHEALRTRLHWAGDRLIQEFAAPSDVPLPFTSAERDPLRARDAALAGLLREPLDLTRGPAARFHLLRFGSTRHELLSVVHHAVADAASLPLLAEDLMCIYEWELRQEGPRPPAPKSFAKVSAERARREAANAPSAVQRAIARLQGYEESLESRERSGISGGFAEDLAHTTMLDAATTVAIAATTKAVGVTPAVGFLAAWMWTLARGSGNLDVAVAVPSHGRRDADSLAVVGPFVDTLIVRSDLSRTRTVRELLLRVDADLTAARRDGEAPFEVVARGLGIASDPDRFPLVATLFNWLDHPAVERTHGALTLRHEVLPTSVLADLGILVNWREDPLRILILEDRSKSHPDLASELRDRWLEALQAIGAGADRVLDPPESSRWEGDRIGTATPLLGALDAAARRHPDKLAVVAADGTLTYCELARRITDRAVALELAGVGPADVVAIAAARGRRTVVDPMAVMKVGATILAIDLEWPDERIRAVIADSGARYVLASDERPWMQALRRVGDDGCAGEPAPTATSRVPAAIAFLFYTSGSTGSPKGVRVRTSSFEHLVQSLCTRPGLDADDVFLAVSSVAFDISAFELLGPLTVGATVVVAARDDVRDPPRLAQLIERHRVTVLQSTPSTWSLLLTSGWSGSARLRAWCGGEPLHPALARQLAGATAGVWNLYGPTETTIWSTVGRVSRGYVHAGTPLPGTTVELLDDAGRPVPSGALGEIVIGGVGVADGYHSRSQETAARFDRRGDGTPIFRTGDLGRRDRLGNLRVLGRRDRQVKIRGNRIELGEVEARLLTAPSVTACCVMKDPREPERLVAFVVGGDLDPTTLRSHVARSLPDVMVPASFVSLPRLPQNSAGKIDLETLRSTLTVTTPRTQASDPPTGPIRVWMSEVLGTPIGPEDDFFAAGGHSLAAARLSAKIEVEFGGSVPLRWIFEHRTPRALTDRLTKQRLDIRPQEIPTPEAPSTTTEPTLSLAQERLIFLERLTPDTPTYNLATSIELVGPLDRDALRAAITYVVRRHEPLHSRIEFVDGAARAVLDPEEFRLETHDLTAAEIAEWMDRWFHRPFALHREIPLRAALVTQGPDHHSLALLVHHVAADAWSFDILRREVATLYTGILSNGTTSLHRLPTEHSREARRERERLARGDFDDALKWHRERLEGAPAYLDLPTDRPRPPVRRGRGGIIPIAVQIGTAEAIETLAREQRTTPYVVLATAYVATLARWTGSRDLVIGSAFDGRSGAAARELVGLFLNTVPLRVVLPDDPTFLTLLGQTRRKVVDTLQRAEVPFDRLVAALDLPRDPSRTPIFSVAFDLVNQGPATFDLGLIRARATTIPVRASKFDLSLRMNVAETWTGLFEFDTDLFDSATIDAFARHFLTLLEDAVLRPETPVSRLSMLGKAERAFSRQGGAAVRAAPAPAIDLVSGLRHIAQNRPEALAVEESSLQATFDELLRLAEGFRLALEAKGVQRGDRVALRLPPSIASVAALFGTLAAGATAAPWDVNDPPTRVAQLVEHVRPRVVITERCGADLQKLACRCLSAQDVGAASDVATWAPPDPESGALAFSTSGSTGSPKTVIVSHRALANYVRFAAEHYVVHEGRSVPWFTPLTVDLTVTSVLVPLLSGCPVTIVAGDDPLLTLGGLMSSTPDFALVKLTPTHAEVLLATADTQPISGFTRRFVLGGEVLSVDLARRLRHRFGPVPIHNEYGPTETTVGCTVEDFDEASFSGVDVPIGRPIPGVRVRVLDDLGAEVPVGAFGELYVGGLGVANGYLDDDAANTRAFVPDPFEPSLKLHRTGDRVRWRSDGRLEYGGRFDSQLKIRGHRIEPGEVAAAIAAMPGVHGVRVGARSGPDGRPRLVAWVVFASTLDSGAMRSRLLEVLPLRSVPDALVPMDELPPESTGKLALDRLPSPWSAKPKCWTRDDDIPPSLAQTFRDALRRPDAGGDDDFFALGGDSISALRFVALARGAGFSLRTRDVFKTPTLRGLARIAGLSGRRETSADAPAGLASTPAQRFWLASSQPERTIVQTVSVRCRNAPSLDELRRAVAVLIRNHDSLRLRLCTDGGARTWMIEPSATIPVDEHRGDETSLIEAVDELEGRLDIVRGPTSALLLHHGPNGDTALIWSAHHLIVDAHSWRVLFDELDALCKPAESLDPRPSPAATAYSTAVSLVLATSSCDTESGAGGASERSVVTIRTLSADASAAWFARCAGRNSHMEADLATAMATAFAVRSPRAVGDSSEWTLDIESLGRDRDRDPDAASLDRVVGWFSSIDSVSVPTNGPYEARVGTMRHRVRDARDGPNRFGPRSDWLLNVHGVLDRSPSSRSRWTVDGAPRIPRNPAREVRSHARELVAAMREGRLELELLHEPHDGFALGLLDDVLALLRAPDPDAVRAELEARDVLEIAPLTPTQEGMLLHGILRPDSVAYREQVTVTLGGTLSVPALRAALDDLVADIDVLRTSYVLEGRHGPSAQVHRRARLPLRTHDADDLGATSTLIETLAVEERARPFDLASPPLARMLLVRERALRTTLIFTFHHVLLDGWSMPLLLRRLLGAYERHTVDGIPREPAPPPFADYARWWAGWDSKAATAWFRDDLHDAPEPVEVRLRDVGPSRTGESEYGLEARPLPAAEWSELEAFARAARWPATVVIQTAFAILLGRYGDANDVVFGLTVSGRPDDLPAADERIGAFLNTLAVRVRWQEADRRHDVLARVDAAHRERLVHSWAPLSTVQASVGRTPDRPLFHALLVVENYPLADSARTSRAFRVEAAQGFERTSYPLTLVVVPGREPEVRVLFATSWLDAHKAKDLLEHWWEIVRQLIQAPAESIRYLDLPLPAHPSVAPDIRPPSIARPLGAMLTDAFERGASDVALETADRLLTYAELGNRVQGLAAALSHQGLQRGATAVLLLPRGLQVVLHELALVTLGVRFVPLHPDDPLEHLDRVIRQLPGAFILVRSPLPLELHSDQRWVSLDLPPAPGFWTAPRADLLEADCAAYTLATSGSSGHPKLVTISRRSLAHFIGSASSEYGIRRGDRVLQFAAPSFDTSLEELFLTLHCGATLVTQPPFTLESTRQFVDSVARHRITVLDLPTAYWHGIVSALEPDMVADLSHLRLVILGGEAVAARSLERWQAWFGSRVRVLNSYGPTETTIVATVADVTEWRAPIEGSSVPIGHPLPGVIAVVVDEAARELPRGAVGELLLIGPTLASEIRTGVGLSEDAFCAFLKEGTAHRAYRTGDRARWRDEGGLEFVGRRDDQLKIRGVRVEPAEVEAGLREDPTVSDASVLGIGSDSEGSTRLVGFVVTDGGCTADDLRERIRRRLPAALVPSQIFVVPALPLTVHGKIDRRRLAELARSRTSPPALALLDDDVHAVAEAMGELLDGTLSADGDFFQAGGSSLTALRLMDRLRRERGWTLPLEVLFRHPTPRALVAHLRAASTLPATPFDGLAEPDLEDEVQPRPARPWDHRRTLLLTGASGSLGRRILPHLLAALPSVSVLVLVRADDDRSARHRFANSFPGLSADHRARVDVLAGDLSELSESKFSDRFANVGAILHSAASTGFLRPFEELHRINAVGTLALLRHAAHLGIPFHHVSTLGVLDAPVGAVLADERLPLEVTASVEGPYARSKWIAERWVRTAGRRGLAIAVYRPGRLIDGLDASPDSLPLLATRACLEVGCVPDTLNDVDITPTDWAARAIVHLLIQETPDGRTWHLMNPRPLQSDRLIELFARRGHPLTRVPFAEWVRRLRFAAPESAAARLSDLAPTFAPPQGRRPHVCNRHTMSALPPELERPLGDDELDALAARVLDRI